MAGRVGRKVLDGLLKTAALSAAVKKKTMSLLALDMRTYYVTGTGWINARNKTWGRKHGIEEFVYVPLRLSFFACLNWALILCRVLEEFCPESLEASICGAPGVYSGQSYPIHPTKSRSLLESIAESYSLLFNILVCSPTGALRRLVDIIGRVRGGEEGGRVVSLCYVTDEQGLLHPGREGIHELKWKGRRRVLPPKPWTSDQDRWILVEDSESFTDIHPCPRDCGAHFSRASDALKHLEYDNCLRSEDGQLSTCRLTYSERKCKPKLDLTERLHENGFHDVSPDDVSVEGLLVYDLETEQVEVGNSGEQTAKTQVHFEHRLYSAASAWSLGVGITSSLLFRAHFLDSFSMVSSLVCEWVCAAMEQRSRMFEKTRCLQERLQRELAYRQKTSPKGYFTRRLSNCLSALRQRCSTLIIGGWNNSKFDNACLVSNGLYVALQSLFGPANVNIVKKDTSIILISAWNPEEEIGLRIVDLLVFHSPCSLDNYLESHKSQLPPGTLTKGTFPFFAMGKCLDSGGRDAGYEIVYADFYDPVRRRNSLHYPYEVFQSLLTEEDGDVEKVLRGGGWTSPPLPGPQVFQELEASWAQQGLTTAFQTLCNYMLRDVIPLLNLTMRKCQLVLDTTGRNMLHQYLSISSYTFDWLLSSGAERGVHFYTFGSRLTQLMREHVTGGLSWVSHRFVEAGMPIPPPRLHLPSPAEEEAAKEAPFGYSHTREPQSSRHMEIGQCSQSYDANSLYGSTMRSEEMLHGRVVTRPKSNAYRGQLDDSLRNTACAQVLAYLSKVENTTIASEFTTGEQYVVINSEKWGREIEAMWKATVGEYLKAEREWRETVSEGGRVAPEFEDEDMECGEDEGAGELHLAESPPALPGDDDDDERFGQLRGAGALARLLQRLPSPGPHAGPPPPRHPRSSRRRISSSSSDGLQSRSSTPPQSSVQGTNSKSSICPQKSTTRKSGFIPKFKLRKDNYRWKVDGLVRAEVRNGKGEEEKGCGVDEMSELLRSMMQLEQEEVERAERSIMTEREEALTYDTSGEENATPAPDLLFTSMSSRHPQSPNGTVIELNTCGANHLVCPCGCSLRRRLEKDPELLFRQRYFNRTLGRVFAEDAFRTAVIGLEYEVRVLWFCQWAKLREEPESAVAAFCSDFTLSGRTFPLDKGFTEEEMLQAIRDERIHGLVQADILIPPAVRLSWASLPPVISRRSVSRNDMREPFASYAEFHGYLKQPTKYLTAGFTAKQMLLTCSYLRCLMDLAQAHVTNVTQVIELQRTSGLSHFIDKCVDMRREADRNGSPSESSFAKLSINGSFGFSLLRPERFLRSILTDEKRYDKELKSSRFYSGTEVGKPGAKGRLYEVSKRPTRAREQLPVILGFTILCEAKKALVTFAWQLNYFLRPTAFTITGGDTDSVNLFMASRDIHDLVRSERREEWEQARWTILTNPDDPHSLREPGLWKVEASGTSLAHLSSKLYSIYDGSLGTRKVAARGANLRGNRLLLLHQAFLAALKRPLHFSQYCRERGLKVVGYHELGPREIGVGGRDKRTWTGRRVEGDGWGAEVRTSAAQRALDWEESEERSRLHHLGISGFTNALSLTNVTIRKDDAYLLHTLSVNKSILLACYSKRVLILDGSRTVPLPDEE